MDVADFVALGEHLEEVYSVFAKFSERHGFVRVPPDGLGRYPRCRIEKERVIIVWIELWMELDRNGRRFEKFQPDLPYELSGGAYFHEPGPTNAGDRIQLAIQRFSGVPFHRVPLILEVEMERCLVELATWDKDHLLRHGRRVHLGA